MAKSIHARGHVVAFVAESDTAAYDFAAYLNAETSGKVLSLTKTYDGYWVSIDDGHPKLGSRILDLGRDCRPSVQVAFVMPTYEKLVGEEVLGMKDSSRSMIRLLLGLPDPEADMNVRREEPIGSDIKERFAGFKEGV